MKSEDIKCVTCKHCTRESYIPQGHSEYTPDLGDWECLKGKFEPSGCLPEVAKCDAYEHDQRGYQTYEAATEKTK